MDRVMSSEWIDEHIRAVAAEVREECARLFWWYPLRGRAHQMNVKTTSAIFLNLRELILICNEETGQDGHCR
jgi:hypothetical protein